MVRAVAAGLAVVALAATAAALPQAQPASFSQQGGESARSADGKWRIFSKAPAKPDAEWTDPKSLATLWLQGASGPEKLLTAYRRGGSMFWLGEGGHVLFVHRDMHLQDARLFTLLGPAAAPRQVQRTIEKGMAAIRPRLASVENRLIAAELSPGGALCLTVEESGLPPGRNEGSFLARKGVFRVAPDGAAARIAACPAGGEAALTID